MMDLFVPFFIQRWATVALAKNVWKYFMIPKPLLEDIVNGKCLPFIGSGFSLNVEVQNGKPISASLIAMPAAGHTLTLYDTMLTTLRS